MGMNIKDEQAHQWARKLASITGESLTEAVAVAIRERLERLEAPPRLSVSERLKKIGEECAPHLEGMCDHAQLLYGEDGLPR